MAHDSLRVAFASPLANFVGGAVRCLLDIAVALKEDGRIEPLVTVPRDGALAALLQSSSIPSVALPTPWWTADPSWLRSAASPLGLLRRGLVVRAVARSVRPWVRWLRTERPDVVVTTTATIPTPALASAVVSIPHVWWLHEFAIKEHDLAYAFGDPLCQRLVGWSSASVVTCSNAIRRHFSPPIRATKMHVVYMGVKGFGPVPNRVHPRTLRVLFLGRLTPGKGVAVALEAMGILKTEPVDVQLRLVGWIDPAYREELNRHVIDLGIADHVEIADATQTPQAEYAWANVVLMCSVNEGLGQVTLEGLKSGRPVIGARSGGTTELILDGVNGFLFTPGNAHELAFILRRLASEPDVLEEMSKNAGASMQGRFTLEEAVNALVPVLQSAAAR